MATLLLPTIVGLRIGADAGGTTVDIKAAYASDPEVIVLDKSYPSAEFDTFDDLIDTILCELGIPVTHMLLAMAGDRKPNGNIQMTNMKHWPVFDPTSTAARLGIVIETVNDMAAPIAGLATLAPADQTCLKPGIPNPVGRELLLTFSSGIGDGVRLENGSFFDSEGGHMTWQPMTDLEYRYLTWLRAKYNVSTITAEVAISGKVGFINAWDFLYTQYRYRRQLTPEVLGDYMRLDDKRRNLGRVVDTGAKNGDGFCQGIWDLLGSILGQELRNLAVTLKPKGGIFLIGSVVQAPEMAGYIVDSTDFLVRFAGEGAQHADMLAEMPIYLITKPDIASEGALALALAME